MNRADDDVQEREPRRFARRDGENTSHEELLDVLCALRRAVHDQDGEGGRDRVDDADHGLLRDGGRPAEACQREESRAAHGEGQRVPVGGLALHRMARQEGDGDAERRDLGQRQIHEDHAAGEDMEAEVDVNARQHEAGEEGQPEKVEHQRARSASARRATSRSKRAR